MQYLYYLCQIGISMSPISNNALYLKLKNNPFSDFFKKGLLVTLSTDDPLNFHLTQEPLMEEYSNAKNLWNLSHVDLCEIASNSIKISNFEKEAIVNDPTLSNVPTLRSNFRLEMLTKELENIFD